MNYVNYIEYCLHHCVVRSLCDGVNMKLHMLRTGKYKLFIINPHMDSLLYMKIFLI